MPTPTVAARIGRYQTRLSRIVDILASHTIQVPIPGQFGKNRDVVIWTGRLYKSDGKTVDTLNEWEANGSFRNQRGVSSPHDLALFMRPLTDDELQAGLATLPASARPVPAPAVESKPAAEPQAEAESAAKVEIVDPIKDPRLTAHLPEIVWNVYQELIGDAIVAGVLPRDTIASSVRGPWAELIAATLVSYLDNPEPKPAAKEPPPLPPQQPPAAAPQDAPAPQAAAAEVKSDAAAAGETQQPDPEKPPAD